jgi:hypothetical protein
MPNEQTSVPLYAASEVLTAANMNISAGTGVPVFATTVTRDAAFGGANEKVLAEGQLCYLSSTNVVQYYDGAAWATVGPASAGGLVFIKSQTIGTTVSSVEVTGAFSATYDNYQIMVSGGAASASGTILLQLGATTTGYYTGSSRTIYNAGGQSLATSNGSNFTYAGHASSNGLFTTIQLLNPQLATRTTFSSQAGSTQTNEVSQFGAGFLDNATQYTAFTLLPTSGTFTGGTIRVYGFANS